MIPLEEYWDQLFKHATGWLGWSSRMALHTPIPQISLALDGKADFLIRTSPFGGGKTSDKDGRTIGRKLRDFFKGKTRKVERSP